MDCPECGEVMIEAVDVTIYNGTDVQFDNGRMGGADWEQPVRVFCSDCDHYKALDDETWNRLVKEALAR
jgi:hypothetical protein